MLLRTVVGTCRAGIRQRPSSWRAAGAAVSPYFQSACSFSAEPAAAASAEDEDAGSEELDKRARKRYKPKKLEYNLLHEFFIRRFNTGTLIEDDGIDPITEDSLVGRWDRQINRSLRRYAQRNYVFTEYTGDDEPTTEGELEEESPHGEAQQQQQIAMSEAEQRLVETRVAAATATPLTPAAFSFKNGGVWTKPKVVEEHRQRKNEYPSAVTTYNDELRAAARTGDAAKAVAVFQRLEEHALSPDEEGYTYALCALGKRSMWQECLRLHAEMVARGFEPSSTASDAVIVACCTSGSWERAKQKALPVIGYMRRAAAPAKLAAAATAAHDAAVASAADPDNAALAKAAAARERERAAIAKVAKAAGPSLLSYAAPIAAAHAEGQLDDADTVYQEGALRGALIHWTEEQDDLTAVDLHGFDIPRAQAALRMVLREASLVSPNLDAPSPSGDKWVFRPERKMPLRVMVGRGTGALQEAVLHWCRHTDPAIRVRIDPLNKGRLLLHFEDVEQWCIEYRLRHGVPRPTDIINVRTAFHLKEERNKKRDILKAGWVGVGKHGVAH